MNQEFTKASDNAAKVRDGGSALDHALFKSVDFKCGSHKPEPSIPEGVLPTIEIEDGKPSKHETIFKGDKEAALSREKPSKEERASNQAAGASDASQSRSQSSDAQAQKQNAAHKGNVDETNRKVEAKDEKETPAEKCGIKSIKCAMPELPRKDGKSSQVDENAKKDRPENHVIEGQISKEKFGQKSIMLTPSEQEHQSKKLRGDVTSTGEKEKLTKPH